MLYPKPELVPAEKQFTGSTVTIEGLADGNYRIDFWDTIGGKVISSKTATSTGGTLTFQPPDFVQDLAGKISPQ
jgi:hypothetical protein